MVPLGAIELYVNAGSCADCRRALLSELSAVPGVRRVRLDAANGRVTFHAVVPVDRVRVAEAVADAGYELRAWC